MRTVDDIQAPAARAIVAQGNALGLNGANAGALKGRPNS